ncbi:MAG: phage Gp37/Gp68 family protein [Isosphaeraceae bacterium]|nr:phage Gp37/Gp68 family protein [Isosphaeraceae bacterium]
MSNLSAIEWTDSTWNPVTGCSKVSPGCAHCYAETLALTRLAGRQGYPGLPWTPANAAQNVILHPDRLLLPTRWHQPRRVFVNSMSDLFHELVPDPYVRQVFDVMAQCPQHQFQVLSKRPERMHALHRLWTELHGILPNVWLGTSIENDRWVGRADELRATPAAIRFISAEPLLGPLPSLDLAGIDWLIVGGESGIGHRAIEADWVRDLRDRAEDAGVAFFFKQWGGRRAKAGGRELDGRTWDEYPDSSAEILAGVG